MTLCHLSFGCPNKFHFHFNEMLWRLLVWTSLGDYWIHPSLPLGFFIRKPHRLFDAYLCFTLRRYKSCISKIYLKSVEKALQTFTRQILFGFESERYSAFPFEHTLSSERPPKRDQSLTDDQFAGCCHKLCSLMKQTIALMNALFPANNDSKDAFQNAST